MEQSSAVRKFEQLHVRPRPGRTLVVGSRVYNGKEDRRQRFADAVGADLLPGDGVDQVLNLEDAQAAATLGVFQHVDCVSVLEHSRRPWALAENLQRLLVPGGTLFLSVPFVWRYHAYPDDYFRFTADGVRVLFPRVQWAALSYATETLRPDPYLPGIGKADGTWPHLPRCEVLGFGTI